MPVKRPQETTRRRLALAVLFGIFAPSLLGVISLAIALKLDSPEGSSAFMDLNVALVAIAFALVLMALIFGVVTAPLWWWLRRRQAGRLVATLAGAGAGLILPLIAILILRTFIPTGPLNTRAYVSFATICAIGLAIGAFSAFGMWLIAYRPAKPPESTAKVFE
ncbi:hypothetical protein BH11PSE2_BH11PSE2_13320 [soil metagenome]